MKPAKRLYRPGIYDLLAPLALILIGVSWIVVLSQKTYQYGKGRINSVKDRL